MGRRTGGGAQAGHRIARRGFWHRPLVRRSARHPAPTTHRFAGSFWCWLGQAKDPELAKDPRGINFALPRVMSSNMCVLPGVDVRHRWLQTSPAPHCALAWAVWSP